MPTPLPEILTAPEVAEALRVSPQTVYRWQREGRLPSITIGSTRLRFRRADIERLLEREETA